jgi:Neuraminidase (sialidase)
MKQLALLVFLVPLLVVGQTKFQVVTIPAASKLAYWGTQSEPAIAINPKNTQEIAAASILDEYYYSLNGGKTWVSKKITSEYGVWGDPVLLFDTSGAIHYFHLSNYKATSWIDRIVCQTAPSLEMPFNEGTFPAPNGTKAQDKHWVVLNPVNNEIYMTWTQFDKYGSANPLDSSVILFSKSIDQGKSWTKPLRISAVAGNCLDGDNTVEGAVPAVGANGEIYVTWAGPNGLAFQTSTDGGKTWLKKERIIQNQVGGWEFDIPGLNRANGLPILLSDNSNTSSRGALYLNWCDQRNGSDNTDVFIARSNDKGKTWTNPIKVNQDNSKKHQFFTWPAIDQSTGNIYIVYYDRRNHQDLKTDVYVSISKDGAMSFEDQRISDKPFKPSKKKFFGDYINIAAEKGVVRAIWPRMDHRKIKLCVTLIDDIKQ